MPDKKLASYIKNQLAKGYDVAAVRYHLAKYGYTTGQINKAFDHIYNPGEVKHIIHLSPATMITLVSVFLGIVVISAVFFFVLKEPSPQQLLDINLESIKTTAKQDGEVSFITELTSLGAKKRYDVFLKHELISRQTNNVLTFKEETKAIETSTSIRTSIAIPSDALPGKYILRTIATYNGERAIATLPVNIEKEEISEGPECEEDLPADCANGTSIIVYECIDGKKIITDEECPTQLIEETCYDNIWNQDEEEIDCGGVCTLCEKPEPADVGPIDIDELSSFEALEKIKVLAKNDPSSAASYCPEFEFQTSRDLCYEYVGEGSADRKYCEKIQDGRTKDICYAKVAYSIFNPQLCEIIQKEDRRNSCYLQFVTGDRQDFSVCEKITNQYTRQSCFSLKQLSNIDAEQLSYYQGLLNESLVSLSLG